MRLTRALPEVPDAVLTAFDRRLDPGAAAPVTVAYSGGGDSLFLLLTAKAWADRAGRRLLALHVDHRLQPQSAAWANVARSVAVELGAEFRALSGTGGKPATGLPAAARVARLTLLAEAALAAGAHAILLGHTADDVRESDFMRREGSTLGHMGEWTPSPIWPQGRDRFHFRPLLDLSRAEIRERLSAHAWDWINDPANHDLSQTRARARATLQSPSPLAGEGLGRGVCPPAPASLHPLPPAPSPQGGGGVLARAGAIKLERPIESRHLRAALVSASGGSKFPRTHRLNRLRERLTGGKPFVATLAGARVEAGEAVLVCRDAGEYARAGTPRVELTPGETQVWDGRFEFASETDGWTVVPLKRLAARLPKSQREALRAIPAAARPSLPVMVNGAETVTCPLLAKVSGVKVRPLVAGRLAAALGLIRSEAEAVATAHGAGDATVLSWGSK